MKLPTGRADGLFLSKPGAVMICHSLKFVFLRRLLIVLSATHMATSFIQEVTLLRRTENILSRNQNYERPHLVSAEDVGNEGVADEDGENHGQT